ncbi:MAG: hypothetical protein DCC71_05970 [Proteobacteria bacterium]|nr:MAG: hypothetical protein DCC71_05970 [Pseudomonadota bacterium]
MDAALRERLLALRDRDARKRSELVARRELWDGYHPEMEQVHGENADALAQILDASGWPPRREVGDDGAQAAVVVALHAIGRPAFQRRCLASLADAAARGEASRAHWAALFDRIRFNERRPQRYGSIFDWDEAGELSPWPIEEPARVDERRAEVGLPPLGGEIERVRESARREGGTAPLPYAERQAQIRDWSRRAGWLED